MTEGGDSNVLADLRLRDADVHFLNFPYFPSLSVAPQWRFGAVSIDRCLAVCSYVSPQMRRRQPIRALI